MRQSLLLKIYRFIFSENYISLKKYTRALYVISFVLLMLNILSFTILDQYNEPLSNFFGMDADAYEVFMDRLSLRLNITEASLGMVGAMLDFIPSKIGLDKSKI